MTEKWQCGTKRAGAALVPGSGLFLVTEKGKVERREQIPHRHQVQPKASVPIGGPGGGGVRMSFFWRAAASCWVTATAMATGASSAETTHAPAVSFPPFFPGP